MHHEHDGDTVGIEVLCNVRDDVSQASESSNAGTGENSNHTDDGGKHNAGACDAEAAVLSNVDQVGDETGLLQAFSKEGGNEDQADGTCQNAAHALKHGEGQVEGFLGFSSDEKVDEEANEPRKEHGGCNVHRNGLVNHLVEDEEKNQRKNRHARHR